MVRVRVKVGVGDTENVLTRDQRVIFVLLQIVLAPPQAEEVTDRRVQGLADVLVTGCPRQSASVWKLRDAESIVIRALCPLFAPSVVRVHTRHALEHLRRHLTQHRAQHR